jgi:hypothetical protein
MKNKRPPAAIGMATAPTLMMLAPVTTAMKPRRVGLAGLIADVFVGGVLCTRLASAIGCPFVAWVRAGVEVSNLPPGLLLC